MEIPSRRCKQSDYKEVAEEEYKGNDWKFYVTLHAWGCVKKLDDIFTKENIFERSRELRGRGKNLIIFLLAGAWLRVKHSYISHAINFASPLMLSRRRPWVPVPSSLFASIHTAFYAAYSLFYSASRAIELLLRCVTSILVGEFPAEISFHSNNRVVFNNRLRNTFSYIYAFFTPYTRVVKRGY